MTRDLSKAAKYYKRSADLGDPEGQRAYAFFLDFGRVVKQDPAKSILYYTFAADNLDLEASLILGNKMLRGYNAVKSCPSALKYYQYAATEGEIIEFNIIIIFFFFVSQ